MNFFFNKPKDYIKRYWRYRKLQVKGRDKSTIKQPPNKEARITWFSSLHHQL